MIRDPLIIKEGNNERPPLCKPGAMGVFTSIKRVLSGIKIILRDLELSLNEGKTFSLIQPLKKALKHIKEEIKDLTCRMNFALPTEIVIGKLNEASGLAPFCTAYHNLNHL